MGGNALLYAKTGRKTKEEYNQTMLKVSEILQGLFPATRFTSVVSIEGKESFGDGDILLENQNLPHDWIKRVQQAFQPTELYVNRIKGPGVTRASPLRFVKTGQFILEPGDNPRSTDDVPSEKVLCSAISFDFEEFQIDLIVTAPEDFEIAQVYYAYNDLGNLMGRIADRMGFKYGWNGLWKNVGEGNEVYTSICVSRNPALIFDMLGYDFEIWSLGFESFENMYEYAASTPFFHREPYMLENRNHKDRVRDEKRSAYQGFIAWLEGKVWLDKNSWLSYEMGTAPPAREREKARYLKRAENRFPLFRESLQLTLKDRRNADLAKAKFNGGIVGTLVPYKGKDLGDFMRFCREGVPIVRGMYFTHPISFDERIAYMTEDDIESYVLECAMRYRADGETASFGHLSFGQCFFHATTGDRVLKRVAGGAVCLNNGEQFSFDVVDTVTIVGKA